MLPPFLQCHPSYCIAFPIVKEEALFTGHSETFSGHSVYDFTGVVGSSYLTKSGGLSCTAIRIPITELQVTSKTVPSISSYSKSKAKTRLSANRIVLLGLF